MVGEIAGKKAWKAWKASEVDEDGVCARFYKYRDCRYYMQKTRRSVLHILNQRGYTLEMELKLG